MIVFRVEDDIPLDPLLLPLSFREATLVEVEVDVLLDTIVEEIVLPPVVITVTCVLTWTLLLRLTEVVNLDVEEASSLWLEEVCVCEVEEAEVEVKKDDELIGVDVELDVEDVETGVELSVNVLEEEESLVGVADVLAGVEEAAALKDVDELESLEIPKSERAPETMELTIPCRLLKMFASSQFACVTANKTASIDSRRIWGCKNIMMMVFVLMREADGDSGRK